VINESAAIPALECRVGLGRLAIATDAIDVLAEYEVGARLPLADRVTYALGVWDGEVVLSLSLARSDASPHKTAGLLLVTPGAGIRWAFEIVAPVGLVEIASLARAQSQRAPWMRTATLTTGGLLQFVDVRALVGPFAAPGASGGAG
jgi:hypothetical protein